MMIKDIRKLLPDPVNKLLDSHPSEYKLAMELSKNYLNKQQWETLLHYISNTINNYFLAKEGTYWSTYIKARPFYKELLNLKYKNPQQ